MADSAAGLRVLVTGGNAGIGFALCKQLAHENGCHVYLGARSAEKGAAAVQAVCEGLTGSGACELVLIDTSSDESVAAAAATVAASLGDSERLYAVVNNAGTGLAHGVDAVTMISTNFYGPKRVTETFLPLLRGADQGGARIVNVGSGAGPMFVGKAPPELARTLCDPAVTMAQVEEASRIGLQHDTMNGYGISKACLAAYTMSCAREWASDHPEVTVSCVSPGFIDTAIVKGFGATKTPEEGTVSIRHCLFADLEGNGYYYGSDAIRSPYHFMRNPGQPAYDGVMPSFA